MDENVQAAETTQGKKKPGKAMATIKHVAIGLVIGLVIGAGLALILSNYNPKDKVENAEVLAASAVFERVVSQNEMVAASQKYNITEKSGNSNTIPFTDIAIPFTDNSFWYRYVGTIKAGVSLENAEYSVEGSTITVSLDAPYIISNTPDMEQSGVLEERNNIFNPIHIEDVDSFRAQCVEFSETQSINEGLFDEAKANIETNIGNMFYAALGDSYTVQVNWRG